MFGKNPILAPENGEGRTLKVTSIFSTLQGEGPYTGHPAIFIRLGGCNLACSFCDTDFDNFKLMTIENIIDKTYRLATQYTNKTGLVVLTGGEPFRQPIELLCESLLKKDFKVQIETNGLIYRNISEKIKIVCSPKNTGKGYKKIREDLLSHTIGIKFILSRNNILYRDIAEVGQTKFNIPVYLQPMDEYDDTLNNENVLHAINLAKHYNHILCLQTHKILNIE